MSRERSLSWARPAFGVIRPIGSWWATDYSLPRPSNLSIPGAGDKRVLERFRAKWVPVRVKKTRQNKIERSIKRPCRAPLPHLQAPRTDFCLIFAEDSPCGQAAVRA